METPYELLAYLNRAARREYDRMAARLLKAEQAVQRRQAERDCYREEAERLRALLAEIKPGPGFGWTVAMAKHKAKSEQII